METVHGPLLGLRPDSGPLRYPATYLLVQVCLAPTSVGLEEAISTVPRNEYRLQTGAN